jgi:thioredoxin-related protein
VAREAPTSTRRPARRSNELFLPASPLTTVLEEARRSGRPALLYFRSQRCGWCDRLARDTFSRPDVRSRLRTGFVAVKYDGTLSPGREIGRRFRLPGFPVVIILDGSGREVGRIVGYRSAPAFLAELRRY